MYDVKMSHWSCFCVLWCCTAARHSFWYSWKHRERGRNEQWMRTGKKGYVAWWCHHVALQPSGMSVRCWTSHWMKLNVYICMSSSHQQVRLVIYCAHKWRQLQTFNRGSFCHIGNFRDAMNCYLYIGGCTFRWQVPCLLVNTDWST